MRQTLNFQISRRASRTERKQIGRIWLRITFFGLALFLIGLEYAFPHPLFAEPPETLSITMHNQRFSAHIIRAPLEKVLATLASSVPLQFFITGNGKNDLISASVSNVPLEKTLEHLLNGYDYAIFRHRLKATSPTSEFRYLTEVEVISRNPGEPNPHSKETYAISSRRTPVQRTFVPTNQLSDGQDQEKPLALDFAFDIKNFQATLGEVFQEDDPEARTLVKELMHEFSTASK